MSQTTDTATTPPDYPMPRASGCPFAPPPQVLALNSEKPLSRVRIWDGSTPWLITGYNEVRALFADPRISVDDRKPGFPHWNEGMLATVDRRPRSLFTSDAEEHARYRRMLTRPFTVARVAALRPAIQKITDDHIDAMLGGPQPADLVNALALPVPSLVISEMLGVPYADAEFFQKHAHAGVDRYATAEQATKGVNALAKYLADLIRAKREDPGEDLVSELADRVNREEITVREAAQLATGVLIAGHETTANMISLGTVALLDNPEQLALLRDSDDPAVVSGTVDELMRYLSIIQTGQRRVAVEDIEIGGETIRAGDGVIIDLAPANWDPARFADPDRLDISRDARHHVGFGFGRHQCVGQQLARVELQIVFETLFRRIPTLRLAVPMAELSFKNDTLSYGIYEAPVAW